MAYIVAILLFCSLIYALLRFLFRWKGVWPALIAFGFLPPIPIAALSIYFSLIEIGIAGQVNIGLLIDSVNRGLIAAVLWFVAAIVACVYLVWRQNRR
jgi:hypothetical protein